jgi:hypothetical protein
MKEIGADSDENLVGPLIAYLPLDSSAITEVLIDCLNSKAYTKSFWITDGCQVFDDVAERAGELHKLENAPFDHWTLVAIFNFIILNFALSARDQPAMRKFIFSSWEPIPKASLIALLYPAVAGIYAATKTSANIYFIVGYTLGNLGYLLLAAGVVAGTFRIFKLERRWQVLGTGVASLLLGIVVSSMGQ